MRVRGGGGGGGEYQIIIHAVVRARGVVIGAAYLIRDVLLVDIEKQHIEVHVKCTDVRLKAPSHTGSTSKASVAVIKRTVNGCIAVYYLAAAFTRGW